MQRRNKIEDKTAVNVAARIRIDKMKIVDFSMSDYANSLTNRLPYNGSSFHTETKFELNEETSSINMTIEQSVNEKDTKKILATIKTNFILIVENLDELLTDVEGKRMISSQLLFHLLLVAINVSLATTRGMLIAKLEGTLLDNIYFPVFDPVKFVPEQIRENVIKTHLGD